MLMLRRADSDRILTAIRYRTDTVAGLADRLIVSEEHVAAHIENLREAGKVRAAFVGAGRTQWGYIPCSVRRAGGRPQLASANESRTEATGAMHAE